MKNWRWVFFEVFRQRSVLHKGFWGIILMKRKTGIALGFIKQYLSLTERGCGHI